MRKTIRSQMGNGFKQSRWGTHIVWTSSLIRMERRYRTRVTYQSTLSVIRSNENGWRFRMVLSDFILLSFILHMIMKLLFLLFYRVNRMITNHPQYKHSCLDRLAYFTHPLDHERHKWFLKSLLDSKGEVSLWFKTLLRWHKWLKISIEFLESSQHKSQGK